VIELLLAGIEEDESMISSSHEVTQLLHAWSEGDEAALERLSPLVQREWSLTRAWLYYQIAMS